MIGSMLASGPDQPTPTWYEQSHRRLAGLGLRVIALAYTYLDGSVAESRLADLPRESYEHSLRFAGAYSV